MEDKFKTIENFFKYDLDLKMEIHKTYPKNEYSYNSETGWEYSKKLYDSLEIMKYYITNIVVSFKYNDYIEFVNAMFETYNNRLTNCGSDYYKLKDFYHKNIGNLNEEINYELNTQSFGYSIFDSSYILKKTKTVNEMLHVLHHVIVNNENFYDNIPVIKESENPNYKVTLYGNNNALAQEIYNQANFNIDSDKIDILSLDNKIVIMARDLGHALSIEIDISDDECLVTYFIPKICNYIMVNNLKGVNPVTKDSKFTVGMFKCNTNNLAFEIIKFMENVPTDTDIIIEETDKMKHI